MATAVSLLSLGWTIGWSVWQHRRTTSPQIGVDGSFAVFPLEVEPEQHVFAIRAANVGVVPTTITGCWSEVEGAAHHVAWARFYRQIPGGLPHTISPGDHWTGFIQEAEFKRAIDEMAETLPPPWRVRVGVRDAASRSYTSPAPEMRPDD